MMAAAMWTKPHVIAFDEPTNYLDFQPLRHDASAFSGGFPWISGRKRPKKAQKGPKRHVF